MTKEEMIDKIYEVISDKTLSFGCRIDMGDCYENNIVIDESYNLYYIENKGRFTNELKDYTIIGHQVMIGDILDWINKNTSHNKGRYCQECGVLHIYNETIDIRKEKRKPIEEQSLDCIEYIYNLIK